MTDPIQSDTNLPAATSTLVTITINRKTVKVAAGPLSVARLKVLGGVPPADDLNEVLPGGQLKLLPDDGTVNIREGMQFISTPKTGGSSGATPR